METPDEMAYHLEAVGQQQQHQLEKAMLEMQHSAVRDCINLLGNVVGIVGTTLEAILPSGSDGQSGIPLYVDDLDSVNEMLSGVETMVDRLEAMQGDDGGAEESVEPEETGETEESGESQESEESDVVSGDSAPEEATDDEAADDDTSAVHCSVHAEYNGACPHCQYLAAQAVVPDQPTEDPAQ